MNNRGFTLVELLVVLIILAITATMAVATYTQLQEKSMIANDQSNAILLVNAINTHNRLVDSEVIPDDLIAGSLPSSIGDFNTECYVDVTLQANDYVYAAAYIDVDSEGNAVFDETNPSAR